MKFEIKYNGRSNSITLVPENNFEREFYNSLNVKNLVIETNNTGGISITETLNEEKPEEVQPV